MTDPSVPLTPYGAAMAFFAAEGISVPAGVQVPEIPDRCPLTHAPLTSLDHPSRKHPQYPVPYLGSQGNVVQWVSRKGYELRGDDATLAQYRRYADGGGYDHAARRAKNAAKRPTRARRYYANRSFDKTVLDAFRRRFHGLKPAEMIRYTPSGLLADIFPDGPPVGFTQATALRRLSKIYPRSVYFWGERKSGGTKFLEFSGLECPEVYPTAESAVHSFKL